MTLTISRSDKGKACRCCGDHKEFILFPLEKRNKDGRAARCRECEYKRFSIWAKGDGRKKRKSSVLKYQATEKGKQAKKRAGKKFANRDRESSPLKYLAHKKLASYVRNGRIIKPDSCETCGLSDVRIHGHHDDYAKPLEVRWLCSKCHTKWHKENGQGLNG